MDSLFSGLFGPDEDEKQQRQHAEDFVRRVETGDPATDVSDEEAVRSYSGVASKLSSSELEEASTQALERFSPEQRREFAQMLQERGGDQAASVDPDNPRQMAQLTTQMQQQSSDGLVGLLGGGSLDDVLGGLLGGGSSQSSGGGGIGDMIGGLLGGDNKGNQSSSNSLLSNPIAKSILAAIAAMAMKKFMGGDGGGLAGGADQDDSGRPVRRDGIQGGETRRT